MDLKNEEKIIQLMSEIRDVMKRHDKGVRPTVIIVMLLLIVLIIVTYLR